MYGWRRPATGDGRADDPAWLEKLSIEKHVDTKTPPVFV